MKRVTIDISALGRHVKYDLDLDPTIKHHAYLLEHYQHQKCYEEEIAYVLLRTLKPGDVAVDVGANLGFFTLMMWQLVGNKGRTVTCEPVKENLDRLIKHLANSKAENITIVTAPLWKSEEMIEFHYDQDDVAGGALWPIGKWWENEKSRIAPKSAMMRATTLDKILDGFALPKVIKIDAEGADQAVLEGATSLLNRHVPYIIVELNPFGMKQFGYTIEDFRHLMWDAGYELFFLNLSDGLPTYIPPEVKVAYQNGCQVKNVLFSTFDDVAKAWPEAIR